MSGLSVPEAIQILHPDPRPGVQRRPIPLLVLLRIHVVETSLSASACRPLLANDVTHMLGLVQLPLKRLGEIFDLPGYVEIGRFLRGACEIERPLELSRQLIDLVRVFTQPEPSDVRMIQDKSDLRLHLSAISWLEARHKTY